ncbi:MULTISPECIES: YciI family protein [unclassified Kribbella]|uniref:YciI family protein n=1 Tax=unclassified Kribbella TaxID=2644121 RepID=UPI0033CCB096
MKFLLLIHNNAEALAGLTPQQQIELAGDRERLAARVRELRASGELLSVLALDDPSTSQSAQLVAGTPVISDRPFLETKEFLAGALLVDCPTIERALELAAEVPALELRRIEVRPVMELGDADFAPGAAIR